MQIQNRGTLAGNLCTASPAGDGLPNLLALDAEIELASAGGTPAACAMRDFLTGYRQTACRADEIVTAILVPKPAGADVRSHFLKLGARRYLVISIAMVAGVIETAPDGRIARARLAVGACSAVPQRLTALEAALRRSARWPRQPAWSTSGACRAAGADRRHPRLGRLSPARGADADARPAVRRSAATHERRAA